MSDLIYIGKDVQSFEKSTRFKPYDRVVLNLDDNNYISSPSVSLTNASVYNSYANGTYKFMAAKEGMYNSTIATIVISDWYRVPRVNIIPFANTSLLIS